MKIGLINTVLDEDAPPMNLLYLATSLKSKGLVDVRIIDHTFHGGNTYPEVRDLDIVGISAMSRYYSVAHKIAKQIKHTYGKPVLIGGSHITSAPNSLAPEFDIGVVGEGENTLAELCRSFNENGHFLPKCLKEISGIVFWDGGQLVKTSTVELIPKLDDIPLPDYSLLDKGYLKKKWIVWANTMGKSMKILTSRGCPYDCLFCASKKMWETVRVHSAERMLQEITELVNKWGIDHIWIDDDLFIVNKQRLEKFAQLFDQSGLTGRITFFCSARTNMINDATCQLLKRIGLKVITFGFESGSDRVLRYLKGGNISVKQHKAAILLCKKYGLEVWGSLMMGNPTETIEDMRLTIEFMDFAIANGCRRLGVHTALPLPGTVFWDLAKQNGRVSNEANWVKMDYSNYGEPLLLEPNVGLQEFKKIFQAATQKQNNLLSQNINLRTMMLRFGKSLKVFYREPNRALTMFRNIVFQRSPKPRLP